MKKSPVHEEKIKLNNKLGISKVNYLVTPTKKSTWSRLILPKYVESIDLFFVW